MAIVKIEQIHLYTDQVFIAQPESQPPEAVEPITVNASVVADIDSDSAKAIAWFAEQGITDFTHLNYGDPAAHADCFAPLNTWPFLGKTEDIAAFPFVYYTEVHDDLPANNMPMVLLYGLDAIQNSNLSDLCQLGK
jgi:hypothetical protein